MVNSDRDYLRDRQLVADAKDGSLKASDRLVRLYEPLCRHIARRYHYPGGGDDDVLQEARVGLLRAIASYQPDERVPFSAFAAMCVHRNVVSGLVLAQRRKHRMLTETARVGYSETGEPVNVADLIPSPLNIDPLQVVLVRERIAHLLTLGATLSQLERTALFSISAGHTYKRIADANGCTTKAVDSARQRARLKWQRIAE